MAFPNEQDYIDYYTADEYLYENAVDKEDWDGYDTRKKQGIVNRCQLTLKTKFPNLVIPIDAVLEFVSVIAPIFNDVYKNQLNGVASFSVTGSAAFTFKDVSVGDSLEKYIPESSKQLIAEANGISLSRRKTAGYK